MACRCDSAACVSRTGATCLLSVFDLASLTFALDTSITGTSDSSPPSPIISGGVLTKPTVRFFLLFDLDLKPVSGPTAPFKSAASGHLVAALVSMRGPASCRVPPPGMRSFSVDGLRKSTTSSLSLNCLSEGSFLCSSLPHFDFGLKLISLLCIAAQRAGGIRLRGTGSDCCLQGSRCIVYIPTIVCVYGVTRLRRLLQGKSDSAMESADAGRRRLIACACAWQGDEGPAKPPDTQSPPEEATLVRHNFQSRVFLPGTSPSLIQARRMLKPHIFLCLLRHSVSQRSTIFLCCPLCFVVMRCVMCFVNFYTITINILRTDMWQLPSLAIRRLWHHVKPPLFSVSDTTLSPNLILHPQNLA